MINKVVPGSSKHPTLAFPLKVIVLRLPSLDDRLLSPFPSFLGAFLGCVLETTCMEHRPKCKTADHDPDQFLLQTPKEAQPYLSKLPLYYHL